MAALQRLDDGVGPGHLVQSTLRRHHELGPAVCWVRPAFDVPERLELVHHLPDDEWLDIVEWRSSEDFAASRVKGANLPGIEAFFATIDRLVSAEEGTLADGE